ncbi:MvaI/BcnI restriction endonuclease family protein [Patescibacteria group bacterium]|nr:MvaI/BcnI restriction endonuclease family protein [Patescibacteria group bacterium]
MTITLKEIKNKLEKIKAMGFIKSRRAHDTGIGKTLEDYLEIKENNIALPDFGVMELKSQRIKASSMLTLFTKSPDGITNAEIRERFGYPDPEYPKLKIIHQTINNGKDNAMGFHFTIDENSDMLLIAKGGETFGYYSLDFLKQKAVEKIGNGLILVLAETKKQKGHEFFYYKEAYILKDIDPKKFLAHSKYDIRLGIYHSGKLAGTLHDHGSAFRITQKSIPDFFRIKRKIL